MPASSYTKWSPALAIEQMDAARIRASIVSITTPAVWWDNGEEARILARICNDYGAQMMGDHPRRFGMLAAIPLPDIDGSLREISYALDTLKLDGVGLLTSYAGKPLGDTHFAPVFEELNRRKVTIHLHPTMTVAALQVPSIEPPTIEFPTDTTRAIASLAFSGAFARYPDINFIFSHGGGTMPMLAHRIASATRSLTAAQREEFLPDGFVSVIKRQYYDIASIATNPAGMAAVLQLIPASQIVYGSDAPFASTVATAKSLTDFKLSRSEIDAIRRHNAVRLFPRFAA
jgi:predicted TIM-barrel fold metal-dependent hydrolase